MNIFKEIIRELDRDRRGKPRRRKPRPKPAPDAGSDEKMRRRGARLSDYHKERLLTQLDPDRSIEDSGAPAAKPHSRKEPAAAWENRKIKKDKTASRPKPSSQDQLELF
jgi:hypothetical protein